MSVLLSSEYPKTLGGDALANYVISMASSDVDEEMIEEYFRWSTATLVQRRVDSIKAGVADHNIANPTLQKKYSKMNLSTMPPILVGSDDTVLDGNHRLRVLIAAKVSTCWVYEVTEEE